VFSQFFLLRSINKDIYLGRTVRSVTRRRCVKRKALITIFFSKKRSMTLLRSNRVKFNFSCLIPRWTCHLILFCITNKACFCPWADRQLDLLICRLRKHPVHSLTSTKNFFLNDCCMLITTYSFIAFVILSRRYC